MLAFDFPEKRDDPAGLRLGAGGALSKLEGIAEIVQAVRILLSTRPGERRLQPTFGCALDRLVYEPNDDTTAGLAIRLITDAIARHEPRANVQSINATADPQNAGILRIEVQLTDRRTGMSAPMQMGLALDGGGLG